jgi:DNA-binding transcriptional MerR regulator
MGLLEAQVTSLGRVDGTKAVKMLQDVAQNIALLRTDISALFQGHAALKDAGAALRRDLRDAGCKLNVVRKSLSDSAERRVKEVEEFSSSLTKQTRTELTQRLDKLTTTVLKMRVRQEEWMDVAKNARLLTELTLKHSAVEKRVQTLVVQMVGICDDVSRSLAELQQRGFWRWVWRQLRKLGRVAAGR